MLVLNTNSTTTITMSSLDLVSYINSERKEGGAELRHDNFLVKVAQVLGEGGALKFKDTYFDAQNKERPCYKLPKREACLMAMSYSYELQAKVFDKMTALEAQQAPKPKTRLELARENVALIEEIEAKDSLLALQAPAVAYVENFVKCDGLIGVREAAKSLGLQQNAFVQMLIGAKIMYRENGHLQSYQSNIDAGRFVVKAVTDAAGKARSSTMLTAKGIRWVAQKLELDKLFGGD